MQLHEKFYSTWFMPDEPDMSCCNKADCYPTEIQMRGGKIYARRREDGAWLPVPAAKVEHNRSNPDGRNHLCAPASGSYHPRHRVLLCARRRDLSEFDAGASIIAALVARRRWLRMGKGTLVKQAELCRATLDRHERPRRWGALETLERWAAALGYRVALLPMDNGRQKWMAQAPRHINTYHKHTRQHPGERAGSSRHDQRSEEGSQSEEWPGQPGAEDARRHGLSW